MAAGGPAEYAVFMLQTGNVDAADVQKIRGKTIGREVILLDLEADPFRVLIALLRIGNRHCKAIHIGIGIGDRFREVGRECRDATLARQITADERHAVYGRDIGTPCPTTFVRCV
jgi:hypothetical protein